MKTMTQASLARAIREGRVEVVSEATRSGYTEIRRTATGKREMVQVITPEDRLDRLTAIAGAIAALRRA